MDIPILHTATVLAGMEHSIEMSHNPYGTDLSLGHEYGSHQHQPMVQHQHQHPHLHHQHSQHPHLHPHQHQHHHQNDRNQQEHQNSQHDHYQHDIQDTMLQTPNPQMPPHIPMTQSLAVTQSMQITASDALRMEMTMVSSESIHEDMGHSISASNEGANQYVELYQKNQAREEASAASVSAEESEPASKQKEKMKPMKFIKLKHQFNCKICGFTTMNKEFAEKHKHENLKDLACVIKETPEGHKKCPYCQYMNKSMKSLRQHMNLHLKEKPFKCDQCLFLTSEKRELMMHEAVHHALNEKKRRRRKRKGKNDDEEVPGKKKRRRRKKRKGKGNEEDDEKPKKKKKRKMLNVDRPPRAIESVCQIKRLSKINLVFKCRMCGFTTPNKLVMDEHEHVKNKEKAFPLPQKLLAQITNMKNISQLDETQTFDDQTTEMDEQPKIFEVPTKVFNENADSKSNIPSIIFVSVNTDENLEQNAVNESEDSKVVVKSKLEDSQEGGDEKKAPLKVIKPTKAKSIVKISETPEGIKMCPYCDFGNKNIQRLKIHIRSHIVKKIKCSKCKFQALDMPAMIEHQAVHTKQDIAAANSEKTLEGNKEADPISVYNRNETEVTDNGEAVDQTEQSDHEERNEPVKNESESYQSFQQEQYDTVIYSCQECSFKGDINLFEEHKLIHNKNPVYTPL